MDPIFLLVFSWGLDIAQQNPREIFEMLSFLRRLLPWPLSGHEMVDFMTEIATDEHIY